MPEAIDSILQSIKKLNNVDPSVDVWDDQFIMYINGAIGDLTQLGIGPSIGFVIHDEDAVWDDFIGDDLRYDMVKNCLGMKVKLLFDPPPTSFAIDALKQQIDKAEWRLNVTHEDDAWVDPEPEIEDTEVLYGGD